ncbi:MAG: hypothetical protein IKM20_07430 [Erysipelotrichales bacterium]|nr:hypothetical protein [Erysipelotrichales bacterium]
MDKLKDKGYTLASMLVVLCVTSCISVLGLTKIYDTYLKICLEKQLELIEYLIIRAKYESYLNHISKSIYIYEEYVVYDDEEYLNYGNVRADDEYIIGYTENGNIQLANTITYFNNQYSKSIVLWIGGGNYEIKE